MDQVSNIRPSLAVIQKPEFDPDNGRYHCCCGCCHVTTGVKLIGALELIFLIFQSIAISVIYAEIRSRSVDLSLKREDNADILAQFYRIFEQNPQVSLAAGICSLCVGVTVIALTIYGLRNDKPNYLLPHFVCQILAILALTAAGAVVVHGAVTVPDRIGTVDKNAQWTALVVLLIFLALFLAAICVVAYFAFVVWRGYTFLKSRIQYENASAAYAYYYSNPQRHPSMVPGSTPRGSTLLLAPPLGGCSPRGSTLLLAPPISTTPRGSITLFPPPEAHRGSFLVVQHNF